MKKISAVFLSLLLLFTTAFCIPAFAEVKTQVVIEWGVNIRKSASALSEKVGYTETDTIADLLGTENDTDGDQWSHVLTVGGVEGYVMSVFTKPYNPDAPAPAPEEKVTRVVIENGVNIRDAAVSGNVVLFTERFIEMTLLDTVDTLDPVWYHVKSDEGIEGYVTSAYSHIVPESKTEDTDGEIEFPETSFFVMCNDMSINLRTGPGLEYDILGEIWPCRLPCYDKETDTDGKTWYKVHTPGGLDAYIREDFVEEFTYDEDPEFEKILAQFPDSYKDGLRHLHSQHPNWEFVPDPVKITFDDAVNAEAGLKSISNLYISIDEDWRTATGTISLNSGYRYASKKAIRYVMEPSNFIVNTGVFMFMDQNFNPKTQTKEGLSKLLKGTFMEDEKYADYLMEAAETYGVNPYALAGLIFTMISRDGNELTSGKYEGYEGYYNFYGWNGGGTTKKESIENALRFAVGRKWKTEKTAIIDGAKDYAENYVKTGQYTYYYKNFNVINEHFGWQFASDILDQMINASMISEVCSENMSTIIFKIPVYKVPEAAPENEESEKSPVTNDSDFALLLEIGIASLFGMIALAFTRKKAEIR